MKKQLNIICILIFFCLGLSTLPRFYEFGCGFMHGVKAGMASARNEQKKEDMLAHRMADSTPIFLTLLPDNTQVKDTVYNQKTKEYLPIEFREVGVWVKDDVNGLGYTFMLGGLALTYVLSLLIMLMNFIKLINGINHDVIFEWINVKRLNRIGLWLLIAALADFTADLSNYIFASQTISLEGYRLNMTSALDVFNVVTGLVALLISRIFAMGLALREEQELTI